MQVPNPDPRHIQALPADLFATEGVSEAALDQRAVAAFLLRAVALFEVNPQTPRLLQRLARRAPDLFVAQTAQLLESLEDSPAFRFLASVLLRQESALECLANPALFSCEKAVQLFRRLLTIDPSIDFRLARMLPGRQAAPGDRFLTGNSAIRAIEILDQTSKGQRLLSVMAHIPGCEDEFISAKAAKFVGHRIHSPAWTARQLASDDQRLRANALEAAWGETSQASLRLLEDCLEDPSNRVAGNALIGLHLAGYPHVAERALEMSHAADPGRRTTAAWAMGKIASSSFVERLTELLRDTNPRVRGTAVRSLVEIGKAETNRAAALASEAVPAEVPQAVAPEPEPPPPPAEPPLPEPEPQPISFELRLDGSSFKAAKRR